MSYKYCVVFFKRARSWFEGDPRPLIPYVRVFRSLERAKEFQREFVKPYPKIYELLVAGGRG